MNVRNMTLQNLPKVVLTLLGLLSTEINAVSVSAVGDLRSIKSNALTNSIALADLRQNHFFGLGMAEGLNQELLILDGKEYTGGFRSFRYSASPAGEDLRVSFLVYGYVPKWRQVPLPAEVRTFADLERALPAILAQHDFPNGVTIPFRLDANVDGLKWFVVDGMGNGIPDFQASFFRSRFLGGLDATSIEGFGIYSPSRQGAWTAPNTKIHFHFRTKSGPAFVGHLDNEIFLKEGAVIWIPEENGVPSKP